MSAQATQSTVELNTTRRNDTQYGDAATGCRHCDSDEFLLIEINAARGQRKYVQSCDACADDYREAPRGLYDPVVIGYTDGADYTFGNAEDA